MTSSKDTHFRRIGRIAEVLSQHGLGSLYSALGLHRFVSTAKEPTKRTTTPTPPEHLRMALEELGPTFVKLGQLLSTRADLLPPKPLAAASIGQAHTATRHDGVQVVIKIQRPGVAQQVEQDLDILRNLAATASQHWEVAEQYDLVGLVEEFEQTIREELDYFHEARNAERFAANFAGDANVHIPRVFWDTSTSRVLTLERISGIKVSDHAKLDAGHFDHRSGTRTQRFLNPLARI